MTLQERIDYLTNAALDHLDKGDIMMAEFLDRQIGIIQSRETVSP